MGMGHVPKILGKYPVTQQTGYWNDELHGISLNTERNIIVAHDIIFGIIEPNDTRNITCLPNVVQHIFLLILCPIEIDLIL